MFIKETSLVIPTKDRREKLKKFIISIEKYVNEFKEILIVVVKYVMYFFIF